MAGQGTIGLELLKDLPDLDTLLVPVGGGGLIAGIATAIKSEKPRVRIIGIEAACVPSATRFSASKSPLSRASADSSPVMYRSPDIANRQWPPRFTPPYFMRVSLIAAGRFSSSTMSAVSEDGVPTVTPPVALVNVRDSVSVPSRSASSSTGTTGA